MTKEFVVYGSATIGLSYNIKADSEGEAMDRFYSLAERDYPCSDDTNLDDVVLIEDDENENTDD